MSNLLQIEIEEYVNSYLESGFEITSQEDIEQLLIEKHSVSQIAKWAIAAKHLGHIDELPEWIFILLLGTMGQISRIAVRKRETVKLNNGKTINMRSLVGSVKQETEIDGDFESTANSPEDVPFVAGRTEEAKNRAINYIRRKVLGHVRSRFNIIAVNDGNVRIEGDWLIDEIEKMADEYP